MYLDSRCSMLLKELLLSPGIKVKRLSEKVNLSRSQINYSLEKINNWLEEQHYPTIQVDRHLGIVVDSTVRELYPELILKSTETVVYVPTSSKRIQFLIMLLLNCQEELSLFHLSHALQVSKNTILADLKKLEEGIKKNNLSLVYSRQNGYFIRGIEFDKRKLLVNTVPKILNLLNGMEWIIQLTHISEQDLLHQKFRLERVEKLLKITFTDEKLNVLPITLLLLLRRMRDGKKINLDKDYSNLVQTEAYKAIQELIPKSETAVDQEERLYLTLQLLASNVFTNELATAKNDLLRHAIYEMLLEFDRLACVSFQEIDELLEKLYQRLKPASYRIKYNLEHKNPLLAELKKEYGYIHHLVGECVDPIEKYLKEKVSDDELGFLTILIISWLQKYRNVIQNNPKAVDHRRFMTVLLE